jgi:4-amino-4-deoxy-L-arabinose transferase-like glycosyltransferase
MQEMGISSKAGFMYRHEALFVFIVGVLLLVPCIWCETSITGQDEYWLSFRTPMETFAHDSWFTPWVNGEPRLKKPPLLYWAILLSYKLLSINLFAARIWGVLAGAGLAACSTLLFRELFKKSGILAGLIALATLTVAIEGRRAMLDLPLTLFTTMALFFAVKWGKSGRQGWILLSGFSLGLSFLVKGPVGMILFAVASLSALFVFRKWGFLALNWAQVFWASVLVFAVSLPWPLIMVYTWPNFLKIVDSEVAARGIGTIHIGSPFSTIGGAFGLVFPWSLILFAALIRSIWHFGKGEGKTDLWLTTWFFGCIVPFIFIRSFARYMTPLIPAASILCANWLEEVTGRWRTGLLRVSISLLALAAISFCLFFIWFGRGVPMAVLSLMVVGLMLYITFSGKDVRVVAGAAAVLLTFMMGGLYPSLGVNAMPSDLDKIVGQRPVAAYNSSQPSMLSIRLKRSAIRIRSSNKDDLRTLKNLDGFVFVRKSDREGFEALADKLGIFYKRAGQFKTFYSRQAWIRFAREDATAHDWKDAVEKRSLANLRPTILYYRVKPRGNPQTGQTGLNRGPAGHKSQHPFTRLYDPASAAS